jgi:DNA-binding transcriptional ArsR family regulator
MSSDESTPGPVALPLYQVKADFFRTLGHPARIRILELLSERDRAVHELLEAISIGASNLSQQLAVLRMAGLVTQRRDGQQVIYSLALPQVQELLKTARKILVIKSGPLVDEISRETRAS